MAFRLDFPSESYNARSVRFERNGELCEAGTDRFVLANIELPVTGTAEEIFVWTCWVSLSEDSYDRMQTHWDSPDRQHMAPAFGCSRTTCRPTNRRPSR